VVPVLFSERKGLKPVRETLQVDSVDPGLRNRLWSALSALECFESPMPPGTMYGDALGYPPGNPTQVIFLALWDRYFRRPLDTVPDSFLAARQQLRKYFFGCEWFEVYDLLEFVAQAVTARRDRDQLVGLCNGILEEEHSGYRFVGGVITEITREEEVAAVEEALAYPGKLRPVAAHLDQALRLLADKKKPDFRNSIKESVSAVEAVCRLITGDQKATLGQALKKIEGRVPLHAALGQSFDRLYGYTSDADGIRHALLEESSLTFDDAKFMLVSCSAFVNYLVAKAVAAGVSF
jgi:AbiJ N-terminal domain 4